MIALAVSSSFFFIDTATTAIYTLSLHDALPILTPEDSVVSVRSASCALERIASEVEDASAPRVCSISEESCLDRKSTRLNSSHTVISYAVFCLKKKKYQRYT